MGEKVLSCLVIFLLFQEGVFAQNKTVFKEDFEKRYLKTPNNSETVFCIGTYTPKQKDAAPLISNSLQVPFGEYYTNYSSCEDSTVKNFYTSVFVYDEVVENNRDFMVIKMDTILDVGKQYRITLKVKIDPCAGYTIDSLGFSFFNDEKAIGKFFREGFENGHFENNISMKEANTCKWQIFKCEFVCNGAGEYLMIGNYRLNNQIKLPKEQKNNCPYRDKQNDNYSKIYNKKDGMLATCYLFLDDIIISEL
ncbi:hypothetical protein QTN47_22590 [Danxiaibacter flavus]|uniref:Uncharacterized protein n=1 Tax=Danxiaibacter flavus TaxID=3049108 RepID=A0ABV3ZMK9_9BACT|nr:hypothetical protein QNM32_22595 [Chitinophagaceae bacterium DXS]